MKCSSGDTVQGVAKARMFPKSFLPCNNVYSSVRESRICQYYFITSSVLNVTFTPKYGLDLFNTLVPVKWQADISKQILCKSFKVDADLVSGTNIAVKSAPMIQSAAYNQNVPENFSGDWTCVGDHKGYSQCD